MSDINVASPGTIDIEVKGDHDPINIEVSHSAGGSFNYDAAYNKPRIEDHVLEGNKTFEQLGIGTLSVQEIEKILYLD